jgi:hypothetical protein
VIVEIIKNSFKPPLTPPYQGGEQDKNSSNYLYKEEINQNPSVSLYQEGINQNLPLDKGELEGVF